MAVTIVLCNNVVFMKKHCVMYVKALNMNMNITDHIWA